MQPFKTIRARAAKRKGGEAALAALLPKLVSAKTLARIPDDRLLADMAKRIFSAGFAWTVIEKKWPGFEAAFLGFEPKRLSAQPDEFWERLAGDARIVRNGQKIAAVRHNAGFIAEIARQHDSFGKFLAAWPASDQVGLLDLLAKRGARLGGGTGQYFLRFIGKDSFVLSTDVVACLRDAGLDIAEHPSSKKDLRRIQDQFNAWADETGLALTHLSRICAMSIGENRTPDKSGAVHRIGRRVHA
jgi:3-methyladenine DNA glycosylase Tag